MLRSLKYGLNGAVLAGLVAAPLVWSSVDKTVQLSVDGRVTAVQTTASTVEGVLHDQGYSPGRHDLIAPDEATRTSEGMRIVLRRGRLLHLQVDGRDTNVWTTATTVQEALSQLGYTTDDLISVSRSRRLPLGPTDIAIRTPRLVTVVHDGTRQMVITTDRTIRQVMSDMGISLGPLDLVSVAMSSAPTPGEIVIVRRVVHRNATARETIPFAIRTMPDPHRNEGDTKMVRPGRPGLAEITYSVVYIDGKEVGRTALALTTLRAPVAALRSVGTHKIVTPPNTPNAGTPDPGSAMAVAKQLLPQFGFGSQDQYDCLVEMWNHESGWRINAANPSGAYGIPQALPGSKMSAAGPDWQTNAATQIKWGLGYIKNRYGTPCGAWGFWQGHSYY